MVERSGEGCQPRFNKANSILSPAAMCSYVSSERTLSTVDTTIDVSSRVIHNHISACIINHTTAQLRRRIRTLHCRA